MSYRNRNTNVRGGSWTQAEILAVWNKGTPVPGYNPAQVRKDSCGALIQFLKFGDTAMGGTGWEIDHMQPVSKGGSDHISNLQPLQWENNRKKSDDWPRWYCAIQAAS